MCKKKFPATDLTEDDVREIRLLKEVEGLFYSEIVDMFKKRGKVIHKEGVRAICRRKSWRHVT